jgi:acyl-CoA reductase-like NAD-dependent aldehyde dehydrogenase
MSARRIIVERPIADAFIDALTRKTAGLKVGDPKEMDTIIGPLINPAALEMVQRRVDAAVAGGARVLTGGAATGSCYQPTLVSDVPADSDLDRLETFGPVATVEVVDNEDDAVERANATSYGLSSGIITSDTERGTAVAARIEAGIVHVNDQPVHDEPQMPFGGVKDSGWGRFGGTFAMDEFTEMRWVTVQRGRRPFPF